MRSEDAVLLAVLLSACGTAPHRAPGLRPPDEVARVAPRVVPAPPPPAREIDPLPCTAGSKIDAWERKLRTRRASADRAALARGAAVIPRLKVLVADAGLPPSLALLPAIESGFRPGLRGRAGELGLWQLRPRTARRFGLVVTAARDDRVALDRATHAAARYLGLLHERYDDWPLALAAYNAGEARIDRALARRPGATFWQLADAGLLPTHTASFVPRFFALARFDGACDTGTLASRAD